MRRVRLVWWFCFVVGLGAGLSFAWVVPPDRQPANPPGSLRADFKDSWRDAIAAAYVATGNLGRAQARLRLLEDQDSVQALGAQAQRAVAAGRSFEQAQELARLASDLQAGVSSIPPRNIPPVAEPPITPTPDLAPSQDPTITSILATASPQGLSPSPATTAPTASPTPSLTPRPSPSAPFRLSSQDKICDPKSKPGLLQVTVLDAQGAPLPGIEISIAWDQGADRFFTGLQPEISPGYADYTMTGARSYSLSLARMGVPVSGITPPICPASGGGTFFGGLQLTFAAP